MRRVYISVLILTLLMWFFTGGIISSLFSRIPFFSTQKSGIFIRTFVPHAVMILTLSFLMRKLFRKSVMTLIDEDGVDLKEFITAAEITILVYTILEIIFRKDIIYNKEDSTGEKILFLVLSLVLFLPQTLAEEAVFRALPERIWAPDKRHLGRKERCILAFVSGIFFLLPHLLNNEVTKMKNPVIPVLTYFLWGFLSSLTGQMLGGYTSPWAMHYANNLFSVTAVGTSGATLSGSPLFYSADCSFSPLLPATLLILFPVIFTVEKALRKKERENEKKPD